MTSMSFRAGELGLHLVGLRRHRVPAAARVDGVHGERGAAEAALPHRPQHLQQEAREGRRVPHQARLPREQGPIV